MTNEMTDNTDIAKLIEAYAEALRQANGWPSHFTKAVLLKTRADLERAYIERYTAGMQQAAEIAKVIGDDYRDQPQSTKAIAAYMVSDAIRAELAKTAPATLDDMIAEMPPKDQARVADRAKELIAERYAVGQRVSFHGALIGFNTNRVVGTVKSVHPEGRYEVILQHSTWWLTHRELMPVGGLAEADCQDDVLREIEQHGIGKPSPPEAADRSGTFQDCVKPWMTTCFGQEIAADRIERNHRFLEEALELVQAIGCTQSEAHQLVDYVYGRPAGAPEQEVGGVMVTLAALCLANGLDMHEAGETELGRIWTNVEKIRAKQAAKPKHSPLPEAATQSGNHPVGALRKIRARTYSSDRGQSLDCYSVAEICDIATDALATQSGNHPVGVTVTDVSLLSEWADDFEAAAHDVPRGIKSTVLMTRAAEVRKLIAALSPVATQEDGWLAFRDAPEDGQEVDLWCAPITDEGKLLTPCRIPNAHYHCGEWLVWGGDPEIGWIAIKHRITHFRYLPAPPSDRAALSQTEPGDDQLKPWKDAVSNLPAFEGEA